MTCLHYRSEIEQPEAGEQETIDGIISGMTQQNRDSGVGTTVQLSRHRDVQPVEDPTTQWKQDDPSFQTVATTSKQDSFSQDNFQQIIEEMRFSIWTDLAAHQPLGNINRARNETYRHSADFRARVNGCPYHEPSAAQA